VNVTNDTVVGETVTVADWSLRLELVMYVEFGPAVIAVTEYDGDFASVIVVVPLTGIAGLQPPTGTVTDAVEPPLSWKTKLPFTASKPLTDALHISTWPAGSTVACATPENPARPILPVNNVTAPTANFLLKSLYFIGYLLLNEQ
jgi:hypothetical protein